MLKFLPRHTARMIEAAAKTGGVQRSHAQLVRATVFESDIRGFTNLSHSMSPDAVVKMLNDYLRVQAEIVEAAGGSIDKFMGDAVLTVFEADGMERRALECALAIQDAVETMNQAGVFSQPVRSGSTVNLAARLCSQAKAGEIVISEELRLALGPETGFTLSAGEEISVKGFPSPIRCYRASGKPMGPRDLTAPALVEDH
jgi:adenylate cyclase